MSRTKAAVGTAPAVEQKTAGEAAFDREEWVRQKRADRSHAYETMDQIPTLSGST